MSEGSESTSKHQEYSALAAAIREVRSANADRSDVVVDLRDAERMRLELLAGELKPVFEDVPREIDGFDFVISSGLQPRLWIDAVSHVAMGRDKRTYRFVRDTRLGPVVLAESSDLKPVAAQITRYVAERMVERQRLLEGEPVGVLAQVGVPDTEPSSGSRETGGGWVAFLSGLYLVASGMLIAVLGGLLFLLWSRLDELIAIFPV